MSGAWRSQPRTVEAGTPSSLPIRPQPAPASAAAAAVPMTTMPSARLGAHHDGSRTRVRFKDRQRARCGHYLRARAAQQPDHPLPGAAPLLQLARQPQDGQASSLPARSAGRGGSIGAQQHARPSRSRGSDDPRRGARPPGVTRVAASPLPPRRPLRTAERPGKRHRDHLQSIRSCYDQHRASAVPPDAHGAVAHVNGHRPLY